MPHPGPPRQAAKKVHANLYWWRSQPVFGPSFQQRSGEKLLSAGGHEDRRLGGCGVLGISLIPAARRSGETGPVQPAALTASIRNTIARAAPSRDIGTVPILAP
jgi:hypothetical protein